MPAAPLVGEPPVMPRTRKWRTNAVESPLNEDPTRTSRSHGTGTDPAARPFDRLYRRLHGKEPPAAVARGWSDAALLNRGRGFMDGFTWTMQQAVGCPAACQSCYVIPSPRLAPADVREKWGYVVRT